MKQILLITTGGTVASKHMTEGLEPGIMAEELAYVAGGKRILSDHHASVFQLGQQ